METRHAKVAKKVLKRFTDFMRQEHWITKEDKYWPFHVLVPTGEEGRNISIYCGGFRKTLEVCPLRKDSNPDNRYNERAYETPKQVLEYLKKHWHLETV